MPTVVIGHECVRELLPMSDCIEVMAAVLEALAKGEAHMPLRFGYPLPLPEQRVGILASMPSYADNKGEGTRYCANKIITVFPDNAQHGHHSHQGAIMLFEAQHGSLVAIVDAGEVTAVRTAACSAVATRLLARDGPGCQVLAILGSGVQARTHVKAMLLVRPHLRRIHCWSRRPESAAIFVAWVRAHCGRADVEIECFVDVEAAVRDADVICTLTPATKPILRGAWVKAGVHVNAVGACTPRMREIDDELLLRCSLFVDARESCLKEPGDVVVPLREGKIDEQFVQAELGQILTGEHVGRQHDGEITLFESLGLAVEDLAAALHVYKKQLASPPTDTVAPPAQIATIALNPT